MWWIRFGRWSHAAMRVFTYDRYYRKGYIWTPFVKVKWRYKRTGLE